MWLDFVLNGNAHGQVGETMQNCRFDPGLMRPYMDDRNLKAVTLNTGRIGQDGKPVRSKHYVHELAQQGVHSPVFNATSLRKEEWIQLDRDVLKAARSRLRAWSDLAAANTYGGFNGMAKTILEHETISDPGEAVVDMDALTPGRQDSPKVQLEGLPLPITHSDFFFSQRRLMQWRNSGTPLDTFMAEAAARRVAEMIERTLIGTEVGIAYGGLGTLSGGGAYSRQSQVYGYTNFPARNVKTDLTTPTGANPEAILLDILEMRDQLYADNFFGPFMLYHSTAYDIYLDNDYFRTGGTSVNQSLRQRIEAIDGIGGVRRLDYLTTGFVLIMVQMTADVARAINGMDIVTVQWEEKGGMRLQFKVMAIQVPQLRADYDGRCGIVHATTA